MPKKKKKIQKGEMTLELIGGVFIVETFPDGKQLRSEMPGDSVMEILRLAVTDAIKQKLKGKEWTSTPKSKPSSPPKK